MLNDGNKSLLGQLGGFTKKKEVMHWYIRKLLLKKGGKKRKEKALFGKWLMIFTLEENSLWDRIMRCMSWMRIDEMWVVICEALVVALGWKVIDLILFIFSNLSYKVNDGDKI